MGNPQATQAVFMLLGDPVPTVRDAVVEALERIGSHEIAAALRAELANSQWHVRETSVRALGRLNIGEPAEQLVEVALHDPDERVRSAARTSLVAVDQAGKVDLVTRHLASDSPEVRGAALTLLGDLSDPEAVVPLIDCLKQKKCDASSVIRALERCGGRRAIPAFVQQLAEPDPATRLAAAEALQSLGWPGAQAAVGLLKCTNVEEVARLVGHAQVPDEVLRGMLADKRANLRQAVVTGIRNLPPSLRLPHLLTALADRNAAVRGLAAQSLVESAASDVLLSAAQNPGDRSHAEALRALAKAGHASFDVAPLRQSGRGA